jgi:DNA-binding transcriptional LysR family regulator
MSQPGGVTKFILLRNEDIHIAIVRGKFQWFDQKYLMREEDISIIYQGHLDVDHLPSLPRINFKAPKIGNKSVVSTHASLNQIIESWWYERYNEPPTNTMQVDSYDTCKEMVKSGLGYAIIPSSFVNKNDQLNSIPIFNKNGLPIKSHSFHANFY